MLLVLFVAIGCSEVIDLEAEQQGGQLMVFGRISNGTEGNYVSVFRTGEAGHRPQPVEGARVFIEGSDGLSEELIRSDSGIYTFSRRDIQGQIGESYSLQVQVGNERLQVAAQEMPPKVGTDSLFWDLQEVETISDVGVRTTEEAVQVYVSTRFDELPEQFYLRWDIEEAYTYLGTFLPESHFNPQPPQPQCFVITNLNPQIIHVYSGVENRARVIPRQHLVSRRIDKSFQNKHYFNVIKANLSKEAYTFWDRLDKVSNLQGTIFDVAPAPIPGNVISDSGKEVLGFFEVVSLDTTRLLLTHNDVPLFFFDQCVKRGDDWLDLFTVPRNCVQCLIDEGLLDPSCINCYVLPGSSAVRPHYF